MNPSLRSRPWSGAVTGLAAAALVVLSAGCAEGGGAGSSTAATAPVAAGLDEGAVRVALTVGGDEIASATLADTTAARELAAALPVTIAMEDRFGQAKAGPLPVELPYVDVGRVLDPEAGHLYYWPSDGTIAIVTAELGPSIPAPGLVDLGTVDTGLGALTSAGNRLEMTIEPADSTQ